MNLLKTTRETLLRPLQAVAGIIERRHTLPILSNVLVQRGDARVAFIATDVEIEIAAQAAVDAPGEARGLTVGARKLLDILRALPEGAEVLLALQDRRLQVKSGKSRFNLQTLPPEDFPRMVGAESGGTSFRMPQGALKRLLALVQYAMAQQDIRYYLNGLLLVVEGGELRLVATDGHRLAFTSRPLDLAGNGRQEVILPRKTVIELVKLLGEGDEPVEVRLAPNQARFAFGEIELVSKLVDGKFPDYNRVIPQNHPRLMRVGRVPLQQALARAAILTSDKFRGVRWMLADGSLRVSCSNTEQEEAQEELEVDYRGEPLDIGFNVGYLLDVLAHVEADEIECALGDASSSALVTLPGRSDFRYVVMPMRI
jgi:DNA polymerase-3 subunit beta